MMLGVTRQHRLSYPTVDIPPWPLIEDPTDEGGHVTSVGGYVLSPYSPQQSSGRDFLAAIHQYLPSNQPDPKPNPDAPDSIACDEFHMYEFKVRRCSRDRSHDWTDCPFAHPGEKARRRDPRKFHYSGTACPDIRKGACRKGDACEFAHGVFECWLHPARYRTQPCKDGVNCRRKVCFFAHSAEQLRVVTPTMSARVKFLLSQDAESPPLSPMSEAGALAAAIRVLQLGKAKSMPSSLGGLLGFGVSPGYSSLPATPTQMMASLGSGVWADGDDEEPVMVRALSAKMFERIRKDNVLVPAVGSDEPSAECPDVGWVSDLVR